MADRSIIPVLILLAFGALPGCRDSGTASPPDWPDRDLPAIGHPPTRIHLSRLQEQSRQSSADPDALARLCLGFEANQLWEAAESCFARLVELSPDESLARFHHFLVSEHTPRRGDRSEMLDRLLEMDPDFAPALDRRGEAFLRAGRLDEAERDFSTLVGTAGTAPQGYFGLAQVHLHRGAFAEAFEAAGRGLEVSPTSGYGYYLMGMASRGLGDSKAARIALTRGARSTRTHVPDAWSLELAHYAWSPEPAQEQARQARGRGDLELAEAAAERAVAGAWANSTALQLLGVIQMERGRADASCATLERALAIDPDNVETLLQLANCSIALGDPAGALDRAERAVALAPQVARAWQMRGRALVTCCESRLGEARESFERASVLDPAEPQIARDLGHARLLTGDLDGARRVYDDLIGRRPWEPWGHVGLAQIASATGDREAAVAATEAAHRVSPNHPAVLDLRRRLGLDG